MNIPPNGDPALASVDLPAVTASAAGADVLLTTAEVALLLRTSPSTIRYWRHRSYGPPGLKVGRRVLYRLEDVHTWLSSRESTEPQS